jgi:catechol 2,3-dioxygenase-like lactoylglutathione lyase family enzyme
MSLATPFRHTGVQATRKETSMGHVTKVGRVMVPVRDQDEGIEFYTGKLGFEVVADIPFGDGDRWVEVAPPAGGAALALVAARDEYPAGRMTGVALETTDARAARDDLEANGVELDGDMMGGDGTVPLLFSIKDQDGNSLMIVEAN